MKSLRLIALVLALVLALGLPAYGQAVNVTANKIRGSATAPSGPCSAQQVQLTTAGVIWVCGSGSWVISGGGGSLTATRVGFGSGANALTGSADFTYADATGVLDLTKTGLNSSVRMTVANASAGTAAQARFGASADVSGAALIAYSSTFTTSGLRTANSAVLDLDGTSSVILGQGAGSIKLGLGTTEYASLTTTAFNLFGPTTGSVTGLSVTSAAAGSGVTIGATSSGSNENLQLLPKGTGGVGIGTLTPLAKLHIVGGTSWTTSGWFKSLQLDSGYAIQLGNTSTRYGIGQASSTLYLFSTSADDASSALNYRMVINTTGNIGIGTISPTDAQLQVHSASATLPGLKLRALSGTAAGQNVIESTNAAGTNTFTVTADGTATIYTAAITTGNVSVVQTNSIQRLSGGGASIYTTAGANTISIGGSTTPIAIGGNANLFGEAAEVLAQRNSTNAQTFRVYKDYTDASNNVGIELISSHTGGSPALRAKAAGTFTAGGYALILDNQSTGGIRFDTQGSGRWLISNAGHLLAGTDNTYDIGASGATRPRNVYVATDFITSRGVFFDATGAHIRNPANGILTFYNSALTDFSRLQFGGTSSSFPALKRSSATLQARLADDSGPSAFQSNVVQSSKTSGYTVTSSDTATAFDNIGAGAGVTFTLPTPAAGLNYRFCRVANQTVTLDITGSETVQIGASVTTAGGNVTLDAVGSCVHIWAVNTTQWFGLLSGTATFN